MAAPDSTLSDVPVDTQREIPVGTGVMPDPQRRESPEWGRTNGCSTSRVRLLLSRTLDRLPETSDGKATGRGDHLAGYWLTPHCTGDLKGSCYEPQEVPPRRLLGLLWHCTDIMPSILCTQLDVPAGTTYAAAAQALMPLEE